MPTKNAKTIRLADIAHARSGDKGDNANVGVIAFTPQGYAYLENFLTPDRVKSYFGDLCRGRVERFELPNLGALNFLLYEILGGGGFRSLRIDAQGKTLAQSLLRMELPAPENLDKMRRKE